MTPQDMGFERILGGWFDEKLADAQPNDWPMVAFLARPVLLFFSDESRPPRLGPF